MPSQDLLPKNRSLRSLQACRRKELKEVLREVLAEQGFGQPERPGPVVGLLPRRRQQDQYHTLLKRLAEGDRPAPPVAQGDRPGGARRPKPVTVRQRDPEAVEVTIMQYGITICDNLTRSTL